MQINITPEQVRASAARMNTINNSLFDTLTGVQKEVAKLDSGWQSRASATTKQVFDNHAKLFPQYRDYIKSYVDFLNKASMLYDESEKNIDQAAASFGA